MSLITWPVLLALYGFLPFVALVFAFLSPTRAVLVSYLAGWLFLPVASIELLGVFDYSKDTAVPLVIFLAVVLFDSRRVLSFRLRAFDLPMLVLCAAPLASSLSNGLGWYDGISGMSYQTIMWGLPYLTGRLYFTSSEGLRQLAVGVLIGGLIYVPLCLWELRMSPQLHHIVYGFHQHSFLQTVRGGGYRPMVFLNHGLMLGLWMSAASLVGLALWATGVQRRVLGLPSGLAAALLVVTTVLCNSFGSLILLIGGILLLVLLRKTRSSVPMAALLCVPLVYVGARVSGDWSGEGLVTLVSQVNAERAHSLSVRLEAEEELRVRALEQPIFGWAGWDRSFGTRTSDVRDSRQGERVLVDSLWIIVFGRYGFVGLGAVLLALLLPVVALWRRWPPRLWTQPGAAVPWVLAVVLTLFAVDNLFNDMLNPVYLLIAGGLCGLATPRVAAARRARRRVLALPVGVHAQ